MEKQFYAIAAAAAILVHLIWILFVIAGAWVTRGRPWLTGLHLGSLIWGIAVEIGPWPCPLTMTENVFEAHAGIAPYSGSFLVHYLDRIVYPDLPVELLTVCAVAICALNLAVYGYRFWQWSRHRTESHCSW